MKRRVLKWALALVAFLCGADAYAQIQVESGLTIEQYVNEVLLGSSGTTSNITYLGGSNQIGLLIGGEDVFGFDAGLVMSCDVASNLACPADFIACNGCLGLEFEDEDLLTVANSVPPLLGQSFSVNSVNDGCVLEFDFVAGSDNLSLEFVFGSDEYDNWINTQYNDVFACFLSGPGIEGPFSSPDEFPGGAVNIAVVPGSDPELPITVSSVNAETNPEYYISNQGGTNPCLNGYTTPITANHPLICGGTYHMKLAIADGTDTAFGSVLILRQGSFYNGAPEIQPQVSLDVGGGNGSVIYEDCGSVTFSFERAPSSNLEVDETYFLTYSGEAVNGLDYGIPLPTGGFLPLPDSVVIPAFESTLELQFSAVLDEVDEGIESAELTVEYTSECSDESAFLTFPFGVGDVPPALSVFGTSTTICMGEEVTVGPLVFGGIGNYNYDWSCPEGSGQASITFSPESDWSCFVSVSDTCGLGSNAGQVEISVEVIEYPELSVELDPSGPLMLGCNGSATLTAETTGGDGNYSYDWSDNNGEVLYPSWWDPSELTFTGTPSLTGISVSVTDGCGFTVEDSLEVSYDVLPIELSVQEYWFVDCFDAIAIVAEATGTGTLSYQWLDSQNEIVSTGSTLNLSASEDTSFLLEVQDNCGQAVSAVITIATNCIDPEEDLCAFVDMGDNGLIPDDQTQCFSAEIEVNVSEGEPIVSDVSEMLLFVNMEHSFMGDLTIILICPNGQSMDVHQQGGFGTNLGVPDQGDGTGPGTGWDYYWSPLATNGTWAGNAGFGGSLPAGTYESAQPFALLEGCPINGIWELEICDSWGADDGYLFEWGLDFGVCDEAGGCLDETACNFDPEAGYDDGSCTYPGCTDAESCNYDQSAGCDDGSCFPYDALAGCTDEWACNYNASALCPDASCIYPLIADDCEAGAVACNETTVWNAELQLCECVSEPISNCPTDLNSNGLVEVTDLLILLVDFGLECGE